MNGAFDLRGETHIEVHKFRAGAVAAATLLALFFQAFLPVHVSRVEIFDLPLLVTIYFALSRRNPSTGLLLGMVIGLLQDSLSSARIGMFGITKTVIGYVASSIGARLDTEHPASRFALIVVFFGLHQGIVILIQRVLLAHPEPWFTARLGMAAAVNAIAGVCLFAVLDRLRKS